MIILRVGLISRSMNKRTNSYIGTVILVFWMGTLAGQVEYPPLSAKGRVVQDVGNTRIEIDYERPSARNRVIFGELVPWNKVWRTGAGECTRITFSKSVTIGGQSVTAGKYALFTIPNPEKWIVILNSDTTLYGSYDYDPAMDVARFEVLPAPAGRFFESLTFDIDVIPNNARIFLSWEETQISFEVDTGTDAAMLEYIRRELLKGKETNSDRYAGAAEYLFFQDTLLSEAITLTEIAIAQNESNGWARRLQMELYEKQGLYREALITAEKALDHTTDSISIDGWNRSIQQIRRKIEMGSDE